MLTLKLFFWHAIKWGWACATWGCGRVGKSTLYGLENEGEALYNKGAAGRLEWGRTKERKGFFMGFGKNLQWLRKMYNGMTQEELAEKMEVTRQTISRWELDAAYPEVAKALELCRLFSCSMDALFREDMGAEGPYSHMRVEEVEGFRYVRYGVISQEPESDAIEHVVQWAEGCGVAEPRVIGWDFPFVSQEQKHVFHMHGYAAAWVLPEGFVPKGVGAEVVNQPRHKYAALTITRPFEGPFETIPKGFQALMAYMEVNRLEHQEEGVLPCFEREYERDGVTYMDIYIAVKE